MYIHVHALQAEVQLSIKHVTVGKLTSKSCHQMVSIQMVLYILPFSTLHTSGPRRSTNKRQNPKSGPDLCSHPQHCATLLDQIPYFMDFIYDVYTSGNMYADAPILRSLLPLPLAESLNPWTVNPPIMEQHQLMDWLKVFTLCLSILKQTEHSSGAGYGLQADQADPARIEDTLVALVSTAAVNLLYSFAQRADTICRARVKPLALRLHISHRSLSDPKQQHCTLLLA